MGVWLIAFAFAQRRFRRVGAGLVMTRAWPFWGAVSALLTLLGVGLLLSNVVAPSSQSGARYLLALALLLTIAGGLFINATFRERQP